MRPEKFMNIERMIGSDNDLKDIFNDFDAITGIWTGRVFHLTYDSLCLTCHGTSSELDDKISPDHFEAVNFHFVKLFHLKICRQIADDFIKRRITNYRVLCLSVHYILIGFDYRECRCRMFTGKKEMQ